MILGIDPGLASTGYAVLAAEGSRMRAVATGTLRTSPRTPHAERLHALSVGIGEVLEAHAVRSAAIESWFVHPVSRSALGMAEARGALLARIAAAGIAVTEYTPSAIKSSVAGNGRADKTQVRAMVLRLCAANPGTDHEADAIAAAICHLGAEPLRAAVLRSR